MKYNIICIIDVEATCWEGNKPFGSMSEIIEIGITELDLTSGNILSTNSIYVEPKFSKVSDFCFKLTGITQELLDFKAIPFYKACDILQRDFISKQRVWASYGDYDRRMFEDQSYREGVNYPFGGKHINIKTLFSLKYKLDKEVGMSDALKILEIPLEGKHHCGGDDSKNIAKILREILK